MRQSIEVSFDGVIDVVATLGGLRAGPFDPVQNHDGGLVRRAVWVGNTATVAQWQQVDATTVAVSLETGPGEPCAEVDLRWFALSTLGADDDPTEFRPSGDRLAKLARRAVGMRFGQHPTVSDIVVPAILGQRVTVEEAQCGWRRLVLDHGTRAPGRWALQMPPQPHTLAALPYYAYHRYGFDRRRAETIRRATRLLSRRDDVTMLRRLESIQGIGPWTMSILRQRAAGDKDAPIIGDFHIPNTIAWHLAGEPRASDQRMLELLSEFEGQRGRAQRLVMQLGMAPKYAPKRRIAPIVDR